MVICWLKPAQIISQNQGDGLILRSEVDGQIIWVEGIKKTDGIVMAKNAGVE